MTLYKSRPSQPLKWAVALIIFIMAMCITFSDVYGTPGNDGSNVTVTKDGGSTDNSGGSSGNLGTSDDDPSPVAVPEPSTLLLLAGGLSALYVVRRLRKQK